MNYEQWKARVDEALVELAGDDSEGLPEYDYYNDYAAGISPSQAAENALRAAGWYDLGIEDLRDAEDNLGPE